MRATEILRRRRQILRHRWSRHLSSPSNQSAASTLFQNPKLFSPSNSHYPRRLWFAPRPLATWALNPSTPGKTSDNYGETDECEDQEEWEEEEEEDAEIGDGGDGGGIVFQGVSWGDRVLAVAEEVLARFGDDDIKLFGFKTTPGGYIYVRLDKLSNEYGCPKMEELERYCQEYRKMLDEVGALGEIPDNLAVEVSSPGAERLLRVPDDLDRFRDQPMRVCYVEGLEPNCSEKDGVFYLDSIENEPESCIWRLADVKENRDPESKGRPMNRKKKDWRLKLPFVMHRKVVAASVSKLRGFSLVPERESGH